MDSQVEAYTRGASESKHDTHPTNALAGGGRRLLADVPMPTSRRAGHLVALLLGYLGLTVWLTWPLATGLAAQLPCSQQIVCTFDTLYSAWVLSWLSHALTTAPGHLANANIYYPAGQALYYGPAGFGAMPYGLPAFLATGNAALAANVALLACATLTALALERGLWSGQQPDLSNRKRGALRSR
jgi:hypothetical protein